ncbi:unnamed protein product [Meganyctiphanes norvegica]|uniref:Ubiquitin-like protease family profile domain-containing protein n=1 Tax=Meganyctiphanes norvegica TaxID=48144 RepID=A0AAV2QBA1_MEGNR
MGNYEDCKKEKGPTVTGGGLPDFKNLEEGTVKGPYTSLSCRSLRIGSYKVMPTERVIFVQEGIRIKMPPIIEGDEKEMVTIDIPIKKIVKILAYFGRSLPVIFVYVKPSMGSSIRNALKMTDKSGFYFDPCSSDESQKRITILPDKFNEDSKFVFKQLFKSESKSTSIGASSTTDLVNRNITGQFQASSTTSSLSILGELDQKEANEILIRSSPEVQNTIKDNFVASLNEVNTLLVYPPAPQKGGISVTTDDYACLEEEQFLNDVIIDFYLKWLLQSKLSDGHRQRTHVFSTFFYKRLTSKQKKGRRPHAIEDDPKLSAAEKRHARVKSWTKNVDIFSKDFIIIPINEHAHWFLALICYPGLDGPVRMSDNTPVSEEALIKPKRKQTTSPKNRIEIPVINDDEWSDRDEAEGDEEELEDDADESQPPPFKKIKTESNSAAAAATNSSASAVGSSVSPFGKIENDKNTLAVRQPCILIFDSLSGGASRSRIVATLRDYLAVEHKLRKAVDKPFTQDTMKGACPRVPQQTNYSDCGIFTLQFAESFYEHPLKDYTFPIRNLVEWFPQEVVRGKREAIAKLIKSLMELHNINHESIELPDISFASPQEDKALKDSVADRTNDTKNKSVSNSAVVNFLAESLELEKTNNEKKSNVKEANHDDLVTPDVDTPG